MPSRREVPRALEGSACALHCVQQGRSSRESIASCVLRSAGTRYSLDLSSRAFACIAEPITAITNQRVKPA